MHIDATHGTNNAKVCSSLSLQSFMLHLGTVGMIISTCPTSAISDIDVGVVQFLLTTILVLDNHCNGVPVAFFVHSRNTTRIIKDCLTALMRVAKKEMADFRFSSVGCDDALEEINAIRSVFKI